MCHEGEGNQRDRGVYCARTQRFSDDIELVGRGPPRVIFVLILDAFDPSTRVREQPTIFVVACLSAAFVPCKTPCLARVGLFVTLGSQRLFMYLFAKTRTPIHYLSSTSTVPRYVDTC